MLTIATFATTKPMTSSYSQKLFHNHRWNYIIHNLMMSNDNSFLSYGVCDKQIIDITALPSFSSQYISNKSDFEILLGCKNPPKQFPLPTTNYGPNRLVIANNVAIHSPYRIPRLDCDCKLPTSSSSSSSRRRSAFHSIRKRRAAMKNIENRFLWTLHLPAAAVAMDGNFAVTTTRS